MASEGSDFPTVPDFDDLPPVEGMPEGCAWGVFDKGGKKDTLGCLNFLTPATVRQAYTELSAGISVSLNGPLDAFQIPIGPRRLASHTALSWRDGSSGFHGWDDEVHFNTQGSSQWDSLIHFAHQETGKYYNGVTPTKEGLEKGRLEFDASDNPTLDGWHRRGGLVARGVLLDYKAWKMAKGEKYETFGRTEISIEELEEIAKYQGTELKRGDVLIVRTGLMEDLLALDAAGQGMAMMQAGGLIGVEGSKRAAKWFWDHRFSAVACDTNAFEVLPSKREDGSLTKMEDVELVLHPYFLAFFGLNIGELWHLEELGAECARQKRWSFLLTSAPLNVSGLVGSPPNALALF